MNELVIRWPRHAAEMTISHNPHKNSYQSVAEYFSFLDVTPDDCGGQDALDALCAGDELWVVRWYPDTPIGFYCAFAATFASALALALDIEERVFS